jgi:hypothetical protein
VSRGVVDAWNRFWFQPFSTATLAVVRILAGLVALGWTVSLLPDLRAFFSKDGLLPVMPGSPWVRSLLQTVDSFGAVALLWLVLLVACVCVVVGLGGRWTVLVAFVAMLSFQRRNPYVLNSGDVLVRLLLLYLVLTPCTAALSVDRWLSGRRSAGLGGAFPARAQVGLRLLQVQLSVVYFATLWAKLRGATWSEGTAVSYALRIGDLERFHVPVRLSSSLLAMNVVTWTVLAVELGLAVLVWNRRLRPWVLLAGVALHLGIELTITVGFFSFAVLAMYAAFLPPEWVEARVVDVRRLLTGSRLRAPGRRPADVSVTPPA